MNKFMKRHKLLAKSKKFLALLLAVALVAGGVPAPAVSAAEASASDDVSITPLTEEADVETNVVSDDVPSSDGDDSLIKYSLDYTDYLEYLEDYYSVSNVAEYGSYDISDWNTTYVQRNNIYVLKDGERLCALRDLGDYELTYTTKWQVKGENGFVDMTDPAYPTSTSAVGNYQLLVEIPAVEGKSAAMSAGVPFEITKAKLEFNYNLSMDAVEPGTLVKDVKVNNFSLYKYIPGEGNTYFYHNEEESNQIKVELTVKDAYNGTALAADTKLLKTGDYYVDVKLSFTDKVSAEDQAKFELPVVATKKLNMAGLIDTEVYVTMTNKWLVPQEEGYTGDPVYDDYTTTYDGEDVAAPVEGVDYNKVVRYDVHYDAEQDKDVWSEISGATVTGAWYDRWENELDKAPVDAGTYLYGLTYAGEAGLYAADTQYITVVVEGKEVIVKPKWATETAPTFYPGMTVDDVLAQVDYDFVDAKGNVRSEITDSDKKFIWGTTYSDSGLTMTYTPVFKLQVEDGEGEDKKFKDFTGSVLSYGKNYRVVFSGYKACYYPDGEVDSRYSVEADYEYEYTNADRNYKVNVEEETLAANVLVPVVAQGEAVTIDVSAILENGHGATYEDPISSTFDGDDLFAERNEYKKAVVKDAAGTVVASNWDSTLTYRWYEQTDVREDGTAEWTYRDFISEEGTYSPTDSGIYRLQVSYYDPTNVKHASAKSVYYVINKVKVKVVPKTAPEVLTETSAYDWLEENSYKITQEIQLLDGTVAPWEKYDDYYVSWKIQEATAEKPDEWNDFYGTFTKGNSYRLAVEYLDLEYPWYVNFTDYEEYVKGTGEDAEIVRTYFNETLNLTLKEMGTTKLTLTVDKSKLSKDTKVYDGKNFDLSEDIKAGLVVAKKEDGTVVSDLNLEITWTEVESEYYEYGLGYTPYEVGTYKAYVSYPGDTTYHYTNTVEVATVTITPKDMIIYPVIEEPVVAGTEYNKVFDYSSLVFEGLVEDTYDAYGFIYDDGYYPAINYYNVEVKDENGDNVYGYLYGNKTYTLKLDCDMYSYYTSNYNVSFKEVSFTTVRAASKVEAVDYYSVSDEVQMIDTVNGLVHTIKPMESIPYSYNMYDRLTGKYYEGNYFAVRIYVPNEYYKNGENAFYNGYFKNSLEKAGGLLLSYVSDSQWNTYEYIDVAFDASALDTKSFQICWEDGYVETFNFDFAGLTMMPDMSETVEPKSISFISPAKKMVVGGTQALDVKLTKKQMNDVIHLQYSVDDKSVLHVDEEEGYVVALAKGKATVTVTPVKYDEATNGYVAIEGAKTAKVTINVKDVTAPKVKKVTSRANQAYITFTHNNDGYRREIYVMEGKGIKSDEFEKRIASMKNQNWEDLFAIAPVYNTDSWNSVGAWYYGLEPNTDYTVYVRNVSAVRELYDGCRVTESASGSVKSFKTTKHEVNQLRLNWDAKQPITYNYDLGRYEMKLSDKSATFYAEGLFEQIAYKDWADEYDGMWFALPLKDKEVKAKVVAPKLKYQVYELERDASTYNNYYVTTSLAKIANNGKLTVKGVGTVYIRVYDSVTGCYSSFLPLTITATPTSMVAKNVTMKVGQSMDLAEFVTYKEGNTVLNGYFDKNIDVTAELKQAFANNECFELNGTIVTAIKPSGKLDGLKLNDTLWNTSATVNIKSAAMTGAKGLKATAVVDKYADMSFTTDGYANKFKIEVQDSRGRVVDSAIMDAADLLTSTSKNSCTYSYRVMGLTKLSTYKVSVTAMFQNAAMDSAVEAKAATKTIKTKNIPASYIALDKYTYNTGINIYVHSAEYGNTIGSQSFYTGNTYTLIADGNGVNEGARVSVTDNLTWTSSNGKVAKVTRKPGTYTATLKAVKAGWTTIEVKSGITKQVIARYEIYVNPVGSAEYEYYGDNEPLETLTPSNIGYNKQYGYKSVNGNYGAEGISYTFTAPTSGTYYFYTIYRSGSYDTMGTLYDYTSKSFIASDDNSGNGDNFLISYNMSKGQTVIINVRNPQGGRLNNYLYVQSFAPYVYN